MKKTLTGCMIGLAVAVSGAVQASEPAAVLAKVTATVLMDREGEYRRVQPGITPALHSGDGIRVAQAEKVTICHTGKTIEVAPSAVAAHLAHGDTTGPCPVSLE